MPIPIQYFVNHKTRVCQMLSGRDDLHRKNIREAIECGFVEVTQDELDAFRAETQKARDSGWNPNGRVSYAKFMQKKGGV